MHTVSFYRAGRQGFFLTIFICLFFSINSFSQRRQSIVPEEQWDKLLEKFRNRNAEMMRLEQVEKENDEIVNAYTRHLQEWLAGQKRQTTASLAAYQPGYKHTAADMNLFPLWEEIPAPVPSLPEASKVNFEVKYQAYIRKVELFQKQMSDMLQQHLGNQRTDKAAMLQDAKINADKNAMVQQMGGASAVMNMSKAERKQAAKAAAQNLAANPGMATGMNNAGMNAMAQKMMTDPAYREAYTKMTDAQKEAELKKFMGNTIEERNDAAFEASIHQRNSTYSMANVEIVLGKCLQKMQDAAKPYNEGTALSNKFFAEVYDGLDKWYRKNYDALPETETHEKIGLGMLNKCKEGILYSYQKKEAVCRTILWSLLKSNTKIAFGEFNDFIGNFPWGKQKNKSMVDGSFTEARVAKAVMSIYDQMIQLAQGAEKWTRSFKGQQEQYETIMAQRH